MSDIFNRLGRLAKSVINDFNREPDKDYKDAWSELDDFLGTDAHNFDDGFTRGPAKPGNGQSPLARDYANLEVSPNADNETIKDSYKKLLLRYHPDKFGDAPEKQSIATEVTTKLNESYKRIIESRKANQ